MFGAQTYLGKVWTSCLSLFLQPEKHYCTCHLKKLIENFKSHVGAVDLNKVYFGNKLQLITSQQNIDFIATHKLFEENSDTKNLHLDLSCI